MVVSLFINIFGQEFIGPLTQWPNVCEQPIVYNNILKSDLEKINIKCFLIFTEQPLLFKKIYNDKYDDELLEILSIFISKDGNYEKLFKMCINKTTKFILTQQLFELYCKIGNLAIIEIFLQVKMLF